MDLLKGLTVILMIFINFFDEVAFDTLIHSAFGKTIDLVITSLVPTVFIFLMGFFLIISHSFSALRLLQKGLFILFLGYLINISRYPYMLYLAENGHSFPEYFMANIYYVNMVDIYLFIGYACLLLIPFSFLPKQLATVYVLLSCASICLTSQIELVTTWLMLLPAPLANFTIYLFLPLDSNVYFPILPWLSYLFLGIACGSFYQNNNAALFFKVLSIAGIFLTISGLIIFQNEYQIADFKMRAYFYQHDYTLGILLLGICLLMPVLAEYVLTRLPNILKNILSLTSRNIIIIYLISWQIICYLKFVEGWNNSLTLFQVFLYSLYIYLACLGVAKMLEFIQKLIKPTISR